MAGANGKVCTGFSKPFVATYSAEGTTVTYTGGMPLARGVSVNLSPETSESNDFYADNEIAETQAGKFSKGKLQLTVDGLKQAAEKMIFGLGEPVDEQYGEEEPVKVVKYSGDEKPPYVGVGFVVRYLSGGITTYVPTILRKVQFTQGTMEAKTQSGENLEYQTRALEATVYRDDSATRDWKWEAAEQTTEAEAEKVLKGLLGIAAA